MTSTVRKAAEATTIITSHVRVASACLASVDGAPNALGVIQYPQAYLADLRGARDEMQQAIAVLEGTAWPSEADYNS